MYVTLDRLEKNGFQKTRSWRTGRLLPGEKPRSTVPNPPVSTGRLGADLAARNAYYNEMAANLQSSPSYGGHSLSSDGGHEFETIKGLCVPFITTSGNRRVKQGPVLLIPASTRAFMRGTNFNPYADEFPWPSSNTTWAQGIFAKDETRLASSISNMLPDHGEMGFGETLVELMRGNIPKAVPDLFKRAKQGKLLDPKGTGKDLGSDYLNAQFGIIPIVKDVIALIEHLQGTSDLLYKNIKRTRSTFGETGYQTWFSRTSAAVSDDGGAFSPYGYTGDYVEHTSTLSVDTVIKAKFAKAKPGRLANTYLDQALLNIRKLGFNEKLAWDLIPFSWLVDWSGNIGASIENAAAFNHSSGRYLSQYMWGTTKVVATSSAGGGWSQITHLKRSQISPFGLNFSVPNMNGYQWSILTALGFSNLK